MSIKIPKKNKNGKEEINNAFPQLSLYCFAMPIVCHTNESAITIPKTTPNTMSDLVSNKIRYW